MLPSDEGSELRGLTGRLAASGPGERARPSSPSPSDGALPPLPCTLLCWHATLWPPRCLLGLPWPSPPPPPPKIKVLLKVAFCPTDPVHSSLSGTFWADFLYSRGCSSHFIEVDSPNYVFRLTLHSQAGSSNSWFVTGHSHSSKDLSEM